MHLNTMHIAGMYLAKQLHNLAPESYTNFSLETEIYARVPSMHVHDTILQEMNWQELQDLLTATQQQFNVDCLASSLDLGMLLVCIMCRTGYFVAHKWPLPSSNNSNISNNSNNSNNEKDDEHRIEQHMALDGCGYAHVSPGELAQCFDCIHSLGSLCLARSECVHVSEDTQTPGARELAAQIKSALTDHHREVSLDSFYEISMVHDLYAGSIAQYMHRHQEVFHSISQVVYYNWPAYARQKQQKFVDIMHKPWLFVVPYTKLPHLDSVHLVWHLLDTIACQFPGLAAAQYCPKCHRSAVPLPTPPTSFLPG